MPISLSLQWLYITSRFLPPSRLGSIWCPLSYSAYSITFSLFLLREIGNGRPISLPSGCQGWRDLQIRGQRPRGPADLHRGGKLPLLTHFTIKPDLARIEPASPPQARRSTRPTTSTRATSRASPPSLASPPPSSPASPPPPTRRPPLPKPTPPSTPSRSDPRAPRFGRDGVTSLTGRRAARAREREGMKPFRYIHVSTDFVS